MTNVAMIGVGKLGQACAEVMAETYPVVGYDVSPRSPKNFEMVDTVEEAVNFGDIIFIAAPTPAPVAMPMGSVSAPAVGATSPITRRATPAYWSTLDTTRLPFA